MIFDFTAIYCWKGVSFVVDRTRDVGLIVYTYNEVTKNISGQFVEHWSEKEQWCLSKLTLSAKLPVDIIEVCDRSKVISGKTKDVFMAISGARYFKSRKDHGTDFTTRLVSNGSIYSWYEGSKEENTQLLQKVGLVPHEHCAPYLAHVQGNKNCKVDVNCLERIFWMSSYLQWNVVSPKKNEISIGKSLLAKQPKKSERTENLSKMPSPRNRINRSF